jgi:ADP-ribose pyrophosphatase YjhB (NUDIX family)
MIVGCLVAHEDRVLLCRRAIEPQYGLWNLPAGFLENGETAEDGARRETLEESGAEVEIIKLHVVYSLPQVNQVYLHFLARFLKPEYGPTQESLEVALFDRNSVPWNRIAFHSTAFALEQYFRNGMDFAGVQMGSHCGREFW